jgi:hypothetical protein
MPENGEQEAAAKESLVRILHRWAHLQGIAFV